VESNSNRELRNNNMDFIGRDRRPATSSALQRLGRLLVAFYSDAVIAVILIFFSRNAISAALRTFLGSSF
jgi:hypothetical protein